MPVLPDSLAALTPTQAQEIAVWTENAADALELLSLSPGATQRLSSVRASSDPLSIPLDGNPTPSPSRRHNRVDIKSSPNPSRYAIVDDKDDEEVAPRLAKRQPLRRDSLNRREALLKGKEGSRRRQKWENGRFMF